jgi:hypothetical protein
MDYRRFRHRKSNFASWEIDMVRRRKISQSKKGAAALRNVERKLLKMLEKKFSLV